MSKKPKTAWESFCDFLCVMTVLIGIGVIIGLFWASKSHEDKYGYLELDPTTYTEQSYEKA